MQKLEETQDTPSSWSWSLPAATFGVGTTDQDVPVWAGGTVVTGTLCASGCGVAPANVGPGHDKETAIRLATVTRSIETCKRPRGPDERFLIATLTSWEEPLIGALDY